MVYPPLQDHLFLDGHTLQVHEPLSYFQSTHLTEDPFFSGGNFTYNLEVVKLLICILTHTPFCLSFVVSSPVSFCPAPFQEKANRTARERKSTVPRIRQNDFFPEPKEGMPRDMPSSVFLVILSFRASCRIRTNDPEITNHVLWPTELKRQVGKRFLSHRYNLLPLLRSRPGGFKGSWS